jgi:hypothetical protein
MKRQTKLIFFSLIIIFSIILVGCGGDENDVNTNMNTKTKTKNTNSCSLPDTSEIPEANLLDMNIFKSNGQIESPVFVTWELEKRTFQVYLNGKPIKESIDQCPGIEINLESDLSYEFKLWNNGHVTKSLWVNVVDKIGANDCSLPDTSEIPEANLLDMNTFMSNGQIKSPVFVTWELEKRTFQVYLNGKEKPIIEYKDQCPGIEINLESDLSYEFKLWNNGHITKSLWVNVVDKIGSIDVEGRQFEENKWITVPGDGCDPRPKDYMDLYANNVELDNSNSSYSQLIANAENKNYTIHNITFLKKTSLKIKEGIHTASYFFQIPSFNTGTTVEGGLFIWVGNTNERLDYGTAFQLIVDETHNNFKKFYYWHKEKWVYYETIDQLQNDYFYQVTFIVNIEDRDASIVFKGKDKSFTIEDIFSETTKDETWTENTVARFQAECISKYGTKHIVNFNNYKWFQSIIPDLEDGFDEKDSLPVATIKKQNTGPAFEIQADKEIRAKLSGSDIRMFSSYDNGSDNSTELNHDNPVRKNTIRDEHIIADNDEDGVIDIWDKCPNTPKNYYTDKQGCSFADDDQSEIHGYIHLNDVQSSVKGSVSLIQSDEFHQQVQLDDNGFFQFPTVNKERPFSIIIRRK